MDSSSLAETEYVHYLAKAFMFLQYFSDVFYWNFMEETKEKKNIASIQSKEKMTHGFNISKT